MKRSWKREVDGMGDMESPRGLTGPEADGQNSECSRSRRGVRTRRGWSTLSSGKKRGRSTGTRSPDESTIRTGGRLTNTAIPKFDGDGCWQQHLQICKSNGWTDETAVLQLFAHPAGEALNVALLMSEGERVNGRDCSEENSRVQLAEPEWILPRLPQSWRFWWSRGSGIWALAPETGQIYCGPTELWAATSPRQCSSGYANPGESGSLPGVGESFGAEEGVSQIQLGARRWIHGFRYPWLM